MRSTWGSRLIREGVYAGLAVLALVGVVHAQQLLFGSDETTGQPRALVVTSAGALTTSGAGGGTQYTEGDPADATLTGTVALMEIAGNLVAPLQGTVADGLLVNLGANNDISGTVTANAGTNLNTSALALETGGNLAAVLAELQALDIATIGGAAPTPDITFDCDTGAGTQTCAGFPVLLPASGGAVIGGTATNPFAVVGTATHDSAVLTTGLQPMLGAVAHGANPTAVAAGDAVRWTANRAGVPFVLGGHPNAVTLEAAYTTAQTDAAVVTVGAGTKIAVTNAAWVCDNANSVDVGVRLGFGAVNTPTTTGVVLTHPGVAAGSGYDRGTGAGLLGVGADGEDLRVTSEVPTSGSCRVLVTYFTIES